ncbi:hypothetical protein MKX01_014341 [Papaver californicum]|nr:hypothetical protein MKX01_014341 [Papaver californicum]
MKLPFHVISNKHLYLLTLVSLIQISTKLNVAKWKNVNKNSCRSGALNFNVDKFGFSEGNNKVMCDCFYNSSIIFHIT